MFGGVVGDVDKGGVDFVPLEPHVDFEAVRGDVERWSMFARRVR